MITSLQSRYANLMKNVYLNLNIFLNHKESKLKWYSIYSRHLRKFLIRYVFKIYNSLIVFWSSFKWVTLWFECRAVHLDGSRTIMGRGFFPPTYNELLMKNTSTMVVTKALKDWKKKTIISFSFFCIEKIFFKTIL